MPKRDDGSRFELGRRAFIKSGTAAAVAGLSSAQLGCAGAASACAVTPTAEVGPFYVNTLKAGLERRDVTEGIPGAAMLIRLRLIDARTCAPLADLPVDIWSASPEGWYSAVDNAIVLEGGLDQRGTTYLRGHQFADEDGVVEFETLFPGWYRIVPPHIHFTVQLPDDRGYTWQFYLDDDFSEQVYTSVDEYIPRGTHPTRTDGLRASVRDTLAVTPGGTPERPIIDATIGIDMDALDERAPEYEG